MKKVVISTIGTSLLTNQIDHQEQEESRWRKILYENTNCTKTEVPQIDSNEVNEKQKISYII